jgi:hypothetical protein
LILLEERIEGIHVIGLRDEVKIKYLRIDHALLRLELPHTVDEVELWLFLPLLLMDDIRRGGGGIGIIRKGQWIGIHWVVVEDLCIGHVVVY